MRVDEIPANPHEAEQEHDRQHEDQDHPGAGALLQLVEAPQELGLLLRRERPPKHELLHDLGESLRVAAIPTVPLGEREVRAKGIDLDAFLMLVHPAA